MHVLVVTDQHPDSLGGAQVAIRTQRASLERLGYRVTIAAPALHRPGYSTRDEDHEAYIDLPSRPITTDREYGVSWPTRRTDRALATALRDLPPVDLVHVQGDFWGAMIGVRAARGLRVPLVFTMHNNVDQGTRAVTPLAPIAFAGLRAWRALSLGRMSQVSSRARRGAAAGEGRAEDVRAGEARRSGTSARPDRRASGAWRYLAELAADADAVIAPSRHFADELERHGVAGVVDAVRGGVDDELIEVARSSPRTERSRPRLVWLGRMSQEKRVLEFVEAFARAGVDAEARLFGSGALLRPVQERISALGLDGRVTVAGPVSHVDALAAMRDADALVQTSVGFETQGLTPFEAAALGTPTVYCDPAIADDVAVTPAWLAADDSVEALAIALREAVGGLAEHLTGGAGLRVSEQQTRGFLQSEQTRRLVEIYERVLADRG